MVKGDPGKGKTMLLITIIDKLERELEQLKEPYRQSTIIVSYFFCQGTNLNLNNATAVLRGLVYLFIDKYPLLISHLRKSYDSAGPKLFEGKNAFFALSQILKGMLRDKNPTGACIAIDAFDECEIGQDQLLKLIVRNVSVSPHIKWVISSRNRDHIEQGLGFDNSHSKLSLELNAGHISQAVNVYIDHKLSQLVYLKNDKSRRQQVREHMHQKSDGTFLWVALAFEELKGALKRDIFRVLNAIPKGLKPLYGRMIEQVQKLKDEYCYLCFRTLSTATLAYRPLHVLEMLVLAGLQDELSDLEDVERIISMCGSFLTIRDKYVYFVHQSAKDYLISDASAIIFPARPKQVHYDMFSRSLDALSNTLRQNIYNLTDLGPITGYVKPDPDPLAPI